MRTLTPVLAAAALALVLGRPASATPPAPTPPPAAARRNGQAEQSVETDPRLLKLSNEVARLRAELREWEARARDPRREPRYWALQGQLRRAKGKLAEARARVAAAKEAAELEETIARLTEELGGWEERARFPRKEPDYRRARSRLQAARRRLAEVRARATRQRQLSDLLGARLVPPGAALVDQLDLPRGQGLVVSELVPRAAGARAGLKAHDILLELAGKPVPSTLQGFAKQVQALKPNTPVGGVLMRKGRKEKFKGLVLPARKPAPAVGW
jgi:hypothetical protein